jgi:hypothetical protein
MKTTRLLLFAIVLTLLLSACGLIPTPAAPLPESMKGYELYSWQEAGKWKFSVLIGTNREKTLAEIQSADAALTGLDALTATLKRIPAGQYLTWATNAALPLPPASIIKQVQQICTDQGLHLEIVR